MKNQVTTSMLTSQSKDEISGNLEARRAELDYMCTYMTWLTIKERYTKELKLMAG